ncbi:enoyl-CoA hydratase [Lysinibacillus sphaericus]|nr:enoyl-CoA hydratase [Lysinibacillus sphaericus]MBG9480266.1 enoyl-CoA hydratase [Lysinibacillus sphaericus]MBG9594945.1 enoyl-CoA hydratase [Lysinibacillus sphaericus]
MKIYDRKGVGVFLLQKNSKLGLTIDEITVGEKIHITEKIEDKDLLLYLGLTNDNNPLYIQHDYAAMTPFQKPIVPTIMLNGIITSAVSKYIPGPGARIIEQHIKYLGPLYHYELFDTLLEVTEVNKLQNTITVSVHSYNEQKELVIEGTLLVTPPLTL